MNAPDIKSIITNIISMLEATNEHRKEVFEMTILEPAIVSWLTAENGSYYVQRRLKVENTVNELLPKGI